MANIAELLGGTKRQDLIRVANNERVPHRGKKKHVSQMTELEKAYLFKSLKSVSRWSMSKHALDRIAQKGINATYKDVVSTIHNSTIIEYHLAKYNEENDVRIVLRAKTLVNNCYNLNAVYSLTRKEVVSCWLNHIDDKHNTIDMKAYTRSLKIIRA
jgi:hypothetical protein